LSYAGVNFIPPVRDYEFGYSIYLGAEVMEPVLNGRNVLRPHVFGRIHSEARYSDIDKVVKIFRYFVPATDRVEASAYRGNTRATFLKR
jgi:hypothetical protein